MFRRHLHLALAHRYSAGHQQRLAANALTGTGGLEALIGDALVGGMHVHQHKTRGILREDINTLELGQRVAQGRHFLLTAHLRQSVQATIVTHLLHGLAGSGAYRCPVATETAAATGGSGLRLAAPGQAGLPGDFAGLRIHRHPITQLCRRTGCRI